jgi:hypothetical protein
MRVHISLLTWIKQRFTLNLNQSVLLCRKVHKVHVQGIPEATLKDVQLLLQLLQMVRNYPLFCFQRASSKKNEQSILQKGIKGCCQAYAWFDELVYQKWINIIRHVRTNYQTALDHIFKRVSLVSSQHGSKQVHLEQSYRLVSLPLAHSN